MHTSNIVVGTCMRRPFESSYLYGLFTVHSDHLMFRHFCGFLLKFSYLSSQTVDHDAEHGYTNEARVTGNVTK